jgi:hypothetical protein
MHALQGGFHRSQYFMFVKTTFMHEVFLFFFSPSLQEILRYNINLMIINNLHELLSISSKSFQIQKTEDYSKISHPIDDHKMGCID